MDKMINKKYRDSNGRFTKRPNLSQKVDKKIVITAIVCLTILEIIALHNGINGTLLSLVIGIIAGLAGWTIPTPKSITNS